MNLRDYIKQAGYDPIDAEVYGKIEMWRSWYRGKVASFHDYTIYNRGRPIRRERASLNMAKQGCEFWAALLWNHECSVNLENALEDALVNEILRKNDFNRQANVLIERSFALGSGAFITYEVDGETKIDYVTAPYIIPLSWSNDRIESCAFAATYNDGNRRLLYLMIHEKQPSGTYTILNRFFEQTPGTDQITQVPTPQGVLEQYTANACRFAIVKPAIANNDADNPMGISVYANCIDTLKSIDLAYDGAKTAMEIGRPRMGVTSNMLQVDRASGELREVFDARDIAVYDMGQGGADERVEVKDLTTPYRAGDFEASLQTQLTIYSQCIGLGEQAFRWQQDAVKTATEVISNNSSMLRTMEKHQDGLRSAITQLVHAILDICGNPADQKIEVVFDDSVTRDKAREAQEAWQWVLAGQMAFEDYLILYKGFDAREAAKIVQRAAAGTPEPYPEPE